MTSPRAEPPTRRAFLSLGSNLGDRSAHLRKAVDQLRAGSVPAVTAVSRVYETAPVGGPGDQGPFLNLVVELAVPSATDPYRLLEQCRRLEAAAGRVRTVRWGPRTLDADILWIDGVELDDPDLTVPHPAGASAASCSPPWPSWRPTWSTRPTSPPLVARSGWWVCSD